MATSAEQSQPKSKPTAASPTTEELRRIGIRAGLSAVGVTSTAILEPARSVLTLRKKQGLAGEMQFTYRNPERSTDPGLLLDRADSLIAGAFRYSHEENSLPALSGRIARYATRDYYAELERGLEAIAAELRRFGFKARVIADQNGLVDRNVAWSAGLGSYGKNANILLPNVGSWFVLGAVVTDAKLPRTGPPVGDQCGPCTRCIDDCPTQAILAPGVVDATRCIAWLVQSDGPIPREFRQPIGDRLYGCDVCQEVCPPNRSAALESVSQAAAHSADNSSSKQKGSDPDSADLRWILSASDEEILDRHGRWYIARRDANNVRRTALIVLGNVAAPSGPTTDAEVAQLLMSYITDSNPTLRSHAIWAARRLGLDRLLPSPSVESDPNVVAEYHGPVRSRFDSRQWALAE